jgi:mannose-6-phosphate isomerase-like protein (cupin superfamily)
MQIFPEAGAYRAPSGTGLNDYTVHLASDDLSLGTYSIPAGGTDDQTPHTEDEIYVVKTGRATLVTDSGTGEVGPGSVIYVPAGETHRFTDVTEDLALIVVFAPPYGSRAQPPPDLRLLRLTRPQPQPARTAPAPPAAPRPGRRTPACAVLAGMVDRYRAWTTPVTSSMPRRASSSARSLPGSPAWPFTHFQSISCGPIAAVSRRHRSSFLTGFLAEVSQPLRCQPWIHLVIPSSRYLLSVYKVTVVGRCSASSAWMAAISSIRLFVVCASPPYSSFSRPAPWSTTPHPPGPGLPLHAPSV